MAAKKKSNKGQLRIVAGIWRSRLLAVADVPGLRPTAVRVRETLFNWLLPYIEGARCLDLCAGTGALGLEALSQGAARAVFVEKSSLATTVLKANINTLKATGTDVVNADARSFLRDSPLQPFDIVFLDPPFAAVLHHELCRLLVARRWLASNAVIYIELDKRQENPALPNDWQIVKQKVAGNVRYMLVKIYDQGSQVT